MSSNGRSNGNLLQLSSSMQTFLPIGSHHDGITAIGRFGAANHTVTQRRFVVVRIAHLFHLLIVLGNVQHCLASLAPVPCALPRGNTVADLLLGPEAIPIEYEERLVAILGDQLVVMTLLAFDVDQPTVAHQNVVGNFPLTGLILRLAFLTGAGRRGHRGAGTCDTGNLRRSRYDGLLLWWLRRLLGLLWLLMLDLGLRLWWCQLLLFLGRIIRYRYWKSVVVLSNFRYDLQKRQAISEPIYYSILVLDVQTHLNVFVDLDHRRTLDVTAGSDADPNSELFRGSSEQLLLELDNVSVEWGAALYTDTLLETHLLVVEAQFLDGSVATVGVDDLLLGLHVDHVIDGGLVD